MMNVRFEVSTARGFVTGIPSAAQELSEERLEMRRGKFQGAVYRGHVYIVSANVRHGALPNALPQDICCLSSSFELALLLLTAFAFGYEVYPLAKGGTTGEVPHKARPRYLVVLSCSGWYWPNTGSCGFLNVGLSGG